ncbi:MAG: zinc ABC transporter substrate-binding protein [Bacteroidales bacterium]
MNYRVVLIVLGAMFFTYCGNRGPQSEKEIISVSIAPFKYFTEAIAGDDFAVNVMVPPGADPHIYEPSMIQVQSLSKSVAYIANGYLDFELPWLPRFSQVNPGMSFLSFASNQELLYQSAWEHGDHWHYEGVDPHFWLSPAAALGIASDLKALLIYIKPENKTRYDENYNRLVDSIRKLDNDISMMLAPWEGSSFMIYHPVLGYFARDYNLEQIAVEHEGKEPSPSELKSLIDNAREKEISTIFVQQEFDRKNAEVIAGEISARVIVIDPLSENWPEAVRDIASGLAASFAANK